jgi:outer membrane protein with beta-barrel domain
VKCAAACALLALLLVVARSAAAQDSDRKSDDRTLLPLVAFNVAGMASFPLGNSSDAFNPGGGFALGVMFRPLPMLGAQLEYSYSWYDVKNSLIPHSDLDGLHTMQYWDLNVWVRPVKAKRVGFYVVGGPGIYRRTAEVTKFAGVGASTYCDPILFYCYPAAVPVDQVIASRSATDFGVNGGLGMYFVLNPPLRLYLEVRYHFIWGSEFTSASGKKRSADGQYLPITLGLSF